MQLPISVDPSLSATLQEQLFKELQRLILMGVAPPGLLLPGSRQLAAQLRISRNTVVLTFDRLAIEGYISALHGRGMVVNPDLPDSFLTAPRSVRSQLQQQRIAIGVETRRPAASIEIDFRIGRPDFSHFPLAKWRRAVDRQLLQRFRGFFDYGDAAGDLLLRGSIASRLATSRGVLASVDDIVIVSGLQEALNICASVLSLRGQRVIVEKPCYARALHVLEHHGAEIDEIAVDRGGILVDAMSLRNAKLIFVTPSHQFPLGFTLALDRRARLLAKSREFGAYIFEDDYDSDFRHEGSPLTALKGLDESDRVIYFGTFSKSLGPGLRLGYVVLPLRLREPFIEAKRSISHGNAWLEQAALAEFIADGSYHSHIRKSRRLYTQRRNALTREIGRWFGAVDLSGVGGGMHLAWHLARKVPNAKRIAALAAKYGIGVYTIDDAPAEAFGDPRLRDRVLLIGYANLDEDQIERGIRRLAKVIEAG